MKRKYWFLKKLQESRAGAKVVNASPQYFNTALLPPNTIAP